MEPTGPATPSAASAARPSTVGAEFAAGLAIVAISLGLLLIPIVHFVTGPLGPGVGAFLMGSRVKPGGRGVLIMSLVAGVGFALVVTGAVFALLSFTVVGSPMEGAASGWREALAKPGTPLLIGGGAGLWGMLLALGGAFAGSAAGTAAAKEG